jgi:hypothetical protein
MVMVSEAEQYKVEDEANKEKVETKNGLVEKYCFAKPSRTRS